MSDKENYTPYGEEWKREMNKLPKAVIIDVAAKIGTERDLFRDQRDQLSANGELIADAFNVRHQINCDLPELLQQRNQLYHALQAIVGNIESWVVTEAPITLETSKMLYDEAKKAIARVELIKEATEL